jgi:hypothetical protein
MMTINNNNVQYELLRENSCRVVKLEIRIRRREMQKK